MVKQSSSSWQQGSRDDKRTKGIRDKVLSLRSYPMTHFLQLSPTYQLLIILNNIIRLLTYQWINLLMIQAPWPNYHLVAHLCTSEILESILNPKHNSDWRKERRWWVASLALLHTSCANRQDI